MPRRGTSTRRHARIRTRLLALLAVPLCGLLVVTAAGALDAFRDNRAAAELRQRSALSLAADDLIDALQAERQLLAGGRPSSPAGRDAVRVGIGALEAASAGSSPVLARAVERAVGRAEAAAGLSASSTGGLVAVDGFSPAVDELLAVSEGALDPAGVLDGDPATLAGLLAGAQEAASRELALLTAATTGRDLAPDQLRQVDDAGAAQRILTDEAVGLAPDDVAATIESVGDEVAAAVDVANRIDLADVADGDRAALAAVSSWASAAGQRVEALRALRDDATVAAVATADALARSSRDTFLLSVLALAASLLVGLLLVRRATRSIAGPLQELAGQADEVARHRLPSAVASQGPDGPVHLPAVRATGAAEVREVAAAFNGVQDTALRLAGEQATLRRNQAEALTNLGRRNQTLVGRQLDFISELERRETDPVFLEHLFRLDHLANRMRRNAESILVLAGSETPRRRRTPAPVAEVVRSAMGEVEDYERIRLGELGEVTVAAPVVVDLVHLLAELVENALRSSPPESVVQVEGRPLGQGGYQLAVIDHGVGLSDVELRAATERMSGDVEPDGMPTRYLGQYVIARLSVRIGVRVQLQPTVGGRGVTAVVTLPAAAVLGEADRSEVARPLPGSRGAAAADELIAPGQVLAPRRPQVPSDPARFHYPIVDPGHAPAAPAVVGAGGPPAPPPTPRAVPDQHSWVPDRRGARPVPAAGRSGAPGATTDATGAGDAAGLPRRVPGASLAGRDDPTPSAAAPAGRSADGVRSMLAAFQSGRSRGHRPDPLDGSGPDTGADPGPAPWGPAREDQV